MDQQPDKNMKYLSKRKPNRLDGFDYSSPGAYFVTVVTNRGLHLFGHVVNELMIHNEAGIMVNQIWLDISERFPGVELDQSIVMPNHFHGIIWIIL